MPNLSTTPLSVDRAFVVQFIAQTTIVAGRCAGRVEHIVSGRATRFTSLDELLGFLVQNLSRVDQERAEGTSPSGT